VSRQWSQVRLVALASLCAVLWGSAFPVIKGVYATWDDPALELRLCFAGVRFTAAGLLIAPFCWREVRSCRSGSVAWVLLLALTQTLLQYVFFYSALAVSSGVLGSILVGTGSLWWIVLAPCLLRTSPPQGRHWTVIVLCSLGVILAVYAPGAGSGRPVLGSVLFLGSTLSGALGAIVIVPVSRLMDVRLATAGALFLGGIALIGLGLRGLPDFVGLLDRRLCLTTLYLAVVSAGAFSTWNWLVREYSVNLLAGYRFLIPLSAVTQSTLFIDGESPGIGILVGGALIVGSLLFLHRVENRAG